MSFENLKRTNVIVESVYTEDGFTVQAKLRDGRVSDVYTHTYSGELTSVEIALVQRGARDYIKGGITGAENPDKLLEKANVKIAELTAGTVIERTVGKGTVPTISHLLQAVMEYFPEITPEVWIAMSKEERAEKAKDPRVDIKQRKLVMAAEQARINEAEKALGGYVA